MRPGFAAQLVALLERLVATGKFDADCVAVVERPQEEIIAIRNRFSDR